MPNVLMVFPRFNQHSFWNLQAVCDTYGSRAQSPPLGSGATYTVKFTAPGTYNYHCAIHPNMVGTIVVAP